jgi:hypothetical protein
MGPPSQLSGELDLQDLQSICRLHSSGWFTGNIRIVSLHVSVVCVIISSFSNSIRIYPNKKFTIPCVYSPEHRGWLVHFVIANSTEEARERGKHVEKSIRNHSRRLNDSLNDSQLMAAFAITRGNITCRDGDEYMDLVELV